MWRFTTDGFYSAVAQRDDPGTVIVRSRVREDAERLTEVLGTGEVLETPTAVTRPVAGLSRPQLTGRRRR